ncbi:MAG TPA: hypothetical protein P5556_07655 [Candidatus Gastranaerophilales bacterium]|nr:hypothetical protein [Candidatus Gastranaerophilales bacterium]
MKKLKNLRNKLDFFLRRNIRFSRKYYGKNELKEGLFDHLSGQKHLIAIEKERLYYEKYNLEYLKNNSTKRNYLENLAIIELLENYLEIDKNNVKILDIGSKNWFYAPGEYNFFKYNGFEKTIWLDGVEIDAFRVYSDLRSRYDYACYYAKGLANCRYLAEDALKQQGKYDYITWFFPFVTEIPLLEWGLPLSEFKPSELLKHAANLLEIGGSMIIVNQDKHEYSIQEEMLKKLNLNYIQKGSFTNSFLQFEHGRYIMLVNSKYSDL